MMWWWSLILFHFYYFPLPLSFFVSTTAFVPPHSLLVAPPSILFSTNPQFKKTKKLVIWRPKRTRLSDLYHSPPPQMPNLFDYEGCPPEYTALPLLEVLDMLYRGDLFQLCSLLQGPPDVVGIRNLIEHTGTDVKGYLERQSRKEPDEPSADAKEGFEKGGEEDVSKDLLQQIDAIEELGIEKSDPIAISIANRLRLAVLSCGTDPVLDPREPLYEIEREWAEKEEKKLQRLVVHAFMHLKDLAIRLSCEVGSGPLRWVEWKHPSRHQGIEGAGANSYVERRKKKTQSPPQEAKGEPQEASTKGEPPEAAELTKQPSLPTWNNSARRIGNLGEMGVHMLKSLEEFGKLPQLWVRYGLFRTLPSTGSLRDLVESESCWKTETDSMAAQLAAIRRGGAVERSGASGFGTLAAMEQKQPEVLARMREEAREKDLHWRETQANGNNTNDNTNHNTNDNNDSNVINGPGGQYHRSSLHDSVCGLNVFVDNYFYKHALRWQPYERDLLEVEVANELKDLGMEVEVGEAVNRMLTLMIRDDTKHIQKVVAIQDYLFHLNDTSYEPSDDPYYIESFLEGDYRRYTMIARLQAYYQRWISAGAPIPTSGRFGTKQRVISKWKMMNRGQRKQIVHKAFREAAREKLRRLKVMQEYASGHPVSPLSVTKLHQIPNIMPKTRVDKRRYYNIFQMLKVPLPTNVQELVEPINTNPPVNQWTTPTEYPLEEGFVKDDFVPEKSNLMGAVSSSPLAPSVDTSSVDLAGSLKQVFSLIPPLSTRPSTPAEPTLPPVPADHHPHDEDPSLPTGPAMDPKYKDNFFKKKSKKKITFPKKAEPPLITAEGEVLFRPREGRFKPIDYSRFEPPTNAPEPLLHQMADKYVLYKDYKDPNPLNHLSLRYYKYRDWSMPRRSLHKRQTRRRPETEVRLRSRLWRPRRDIAEKAIKVYDYVEKMRKIEAIARHNVGEDGGMKPVHTARGPKEIEKALKEEKKSCDDLNLETSASVGGVREGRGMIGGGDTILNAHRQTEGARTGLGGWVVGMFGSRYPWSAVAAVATVKRSFYSLARSGRTPCSGWVGNRSQFRPPLLRQPNVPAFLLASGFSSLQFLPLSSDDSKSPSTLRIFSSSSPIEPIDDDTPPTSSSSYQPSSYYPPTSLKCSPPLRLAGADIISTFPPYFPHHAAPYTNTTANPYDDGYGMTNHQKERATRGQPFPFCYNKVKYRYAKRPRVASWEVRGEKRGEWLQKREKERQMVETRRRAYSFQSILLTDDGGGTWGHPNVFETSGSRRPFYGVAADAHVGTYSIWYDKAEESEDEVAAAVVDTEEKEEEEKEEEFVWTVGEDEENNQQDGAVLTRLFAQTNGKCFLVQHAGVRRQQFGVRTATTLNSRPTVGRRLQFNSILPSSFLPVCRRTPAVVQFARSSSAADSSTDIPTDSFSETDTADEEMGEPRKDEEKRQKMGEKGLELEAVPQLQKGRLKTTIRGKLEQVGENDDDIESMMRPGDEIISDGENEEWDEEKMRAEVFQAADREKLIRQRLFGENAEELRRQCNRQRQRLAMPLLPTRGTGPDSVPSCKLVVYDSDDYNEVHFKRNLIRVLQRSTDEQADRTWSQMKHYGIGDVKEFYESLKADSVAFALRSLKVWADVEEYAPLVDPPPTADEITRIRYMKMKEEEPDKHDGIIVNDLWKGLQENQINPCLDEEREEEDGW
eukprot:GHVS01034074.1.p1 GENE.GHVS01034074.1~~GHVS01034074.1.p1  ORF type:complete len:1694 (-),score=335.31 GHVS01034074.1:50-5131(-)